jgi:hypothetical protein
VRESERGIVVRKSDNPDGAKSPRQKHASPLTLRRTRLDFDPTPEDLEEEDNVPVNTTPDDPAWWSRKSTVRLPVKVAELRWKLYQKAKQEPGRSQRAYRPPAGETFYAHVHGLGLRRP